MEKSEIIKMFLKRGLQITNDALIFFAEDPKKLNIFFSKQHHHPPTITLDFIKGVLEESSRVQFIKTNTIKKKIGINDIVDYFNERYSFLSNLLNKRLDLVNLISINKISEKSKTFSIIGLVKEKDTKNNAVVIEDRSGETPIILSENLLSQIVEDEVVGIVCEKKDTLIYGRKLIFPDIPLQRVINKTKEDVQILVVSDIPPDSEFFNKIFYEKLISWLQDQKTKVTIFIIDDISSRKEDVIEFLSSIPKPHEAFIINGEADKELGKYMLPNPSFIQIENVKIILFHNQRINRYINFFGTPEQTIINLIKKRHLDPTFTSESKIYDNDPYLLDMIPDIVVAAHIHPPSVANYKGITIVSTGSITTQPIFWLINLRTRETFKREFS